MKNKPSIQNLKEYLINPITYYISFPILLCILFGSLAFNDYLWLDEVYTVTHINLGLEELLSVFATEPHPPLYFLVLKAFCAVFGTEILAMKLFSVLGSLCTILLGPIAIRRAFGDKVAVWFMFLCLTMPFMMIYSVEMRMYSWVIFFVTAALIYAILALKAIKQPGKQAVIYGGLYFIFGLLAMYTHYYALAAIAVWHALIGLYLIATNKSKILAWIITSVLFIISYLPWLSLFVSNLSRVSGNFWIEPLSFIDIFEIPASILYCGNIPLSILLAGVLVIFGFMMIYRIISTKHIGAEEKTAIACIIVPAVIYCITIGFSLLIQPIIQARYIMVMAGFGFVFLSIFLSVLKSKKVIVAFCILMLITTCVCYGFCFGNAYPAQGDSLYEMSDKIKHDIPDDCILLHSEAHSYGVLVYHLKNRTHWYVLPSKKEIDAVALDVRKLPGQFVDFETVNSTIHSGKKVVFVTVNDNKVSNLITDNFNVTPYKQYSSNSDWYPLWSLWKIDSKN